MHDAEATLTIDGLALRQIVIVLAGEELVPVSSNDAFEIPAACEAGLLILESVFAYPPYTL